MAPKVFIYTECKLSTKVYIFILGWLEGWHEAFWGGFSHPCHPGRTATAVNVSVCGFVILSFCLSVRIFKMLLLGFG